LTLKEILDLANKGYPDGFLEGFYDENGKFKDPVPGDGLARFVVLEIGETFDPDDPKDVQLKAAIGVMEAAVRDLEGVIEALMKGGD